MVYTTQTKKKNIFFSHSSYMSEDVECKFDLIKLASIRSKHIPAMQTTDTKLFIQTIIFLKAKKKS